MSLGLGIFLAALVIGAVMLRDKVRWGRLFLGLIALVALFGSSLYLHDWYVSLPSYQKEYEDVALGMDRDEVLYVRGNPLSGYYPTHKQSLIDKGTSEFDAFFASFIKTENLPQGLSINEASNWTYEAYKAWIRIYFDGAGRVRGIQCSATEDNYPYACDLVSKVGIGSNEEKVKQAFGSPNKETIQHGFKRLRFDKYNVGFTLVRQTVSVIAVGEAWEEPSSAD